MCAADEKDRRHGALPSVFADLRFVGHHIQPYFLLMVAAKIKHKKADKKEAVVPIALLPFLVLFSTTKVTCRCTDRWIDS